MQLDFYLRIISTLSYSLEWIKFKSSKIVASASNARWLSLLQITDQLTMIVSRCEKSVQLQPQLNIKFYMIYSSHIKQVIVHLVDLLWDQLYWKSIDITNFLLFLFKSKLYVSMSSHWLSFVCLNFIWLRNCNSYNVVNESQTVHSWIVSCSLLQ